MFSDAALSVLSLTVAVGAVAMPTARLVLRAGARCMAGPAAHRWAPAMQVGLGGGAFGVVAAAGLAVDGMAATSVAAALLIGLLAAMDAAWRWLPHEWTGGLALLGLAAASTQGGLPAALLGAALGGGALLALRTWWRWRHGTEGLGFGDVTLGAAIGTHAGPELVAWVLLGAALSGLAAEGLSRFRRATARSRRPGIAFGTHLCAIFALASLGAIAA